MGKVNDIGPISTNNNVGMFSDSPVAIPGTRFIKNFTLVGPIFQVGRSVYIQSAVGIFDQPVMAFEPESFRPLPVQF